MAASDKNVINESVIGVRGKRAIALHCAIAIMTVLSLANLLTTVALIGVLKLSYRGLGGLEFIPPGAMLRFLDDVYIKSILFDSRVSFGSHKDRDLSIDLDESFVNFVVTNGSRLRLAGTVELDTELFEVYNSAGDQLLFSTNFSKKPIAMMPMTVGEFEPFLEAEKMTSERMLRLRSENRVLLSSGRDLLATGQQSLVEAGADITVESKYNGITLSGGRGLYLENIVDASDFDFSHRLSTITRKLYERNKKERCLASCRIPQSLQICCTCWGWWWCPVGFKGNGVAAAIVLAAKKNSENFVVFLGPN